MSKAFFQMRLCCCYNGLASFPDLPTSAFALPVLMLAVPWNEANHDPFLELHGCHSCLLTTLFISGSYIFPVQSRYGRYGFGCSTCQEPKLSGGEAFVGVTRTRGNNYTMQRYGQLLANVSSLPMCLICHLPLTTLQKLSLFQREASGKQRLSGIHFNLLRQLYLTIKTQLLHVYVLSYVEELHGLTTQI